LLPNFLLFIDTKYFKVAYLAEHHRAAVIDNRNITVAQIRSNERLQFSNTITYQQAHRTIKALQEEIDGDEADSFARFPAFAERYLAADTDNFCKLEVDENGHFEAFFMAPAGTRYGHRYLRPFIGLDGTHTKSRFRMMLLIACSIDANDEILPLA
jgi:hypothetical protein